ncbi:nucleotidyltransferase domain-containing protein [Spirosoma sp. KUDC1026]|uniref:nucleotidyltransferase domain-containing protein n=1 Tax=Spirosoma sp. KUDC1026 TaxID=2745947 RepID=UPI00159BA829|nr:nucleotidyltransferase domain-containing protein [Spirosoma sp. KUDC1026]QKZ15332.1 nucleotidyltransferase domain-containing protein [Spirosoma sp. KUDC1026]
MITPLDTLGSEFKEGLQAIYGSQLTSLILFGSYARGDFQPESDVDFAIVLKDPATRPSAEIFRLAPLSAELSLKYGLLISVLPVSEQKLNTSGQGVYEAIRNEGIQL